MTWFNLIKSSRLARLKEFVRSNRKKGWLHLIKPSSDYNNKAEFIPAIEGAAVKLYNGLEPGDSTTHYSEVGDYGYQFVIRRRMESYDDLYSNAILVVELKGDNPNKVISLIMVSENLKLLDEWDSILEG